VRYGNPNLVYAPAKIKIKPGYKINEKQLKSILYYISYRLSNCKVNNIIKINNIAGVSEFKYSYYLS